MSRTRALALLALACLLAASAAAAGAGASEESFRANVSSAQTPAGTEAAVSDRLAFEVPAETERIEVRADWVDASDRMSLEVTVEECGLLCEPRNLAEASGSPPLEVRLAAPNASEISLDPAAEDGVAADREVRGTVTFLSGKPAADDGAEPASTSTPTRSTDTDGSESAIARLAAAGSLAGLAVFAMAARRVGGAGTPLVSLYHRLRDREELLDHPSREAIYERVGRTPGIHFEALARDLDMGRGNLDHHLSKLRRAGLLEERRTAGYRAYFRPGEVPRRLQEPLVLLKAEGARRLVENADGAGVRELARRTGLAPSTVSHHVDQLDEAGLLRVRENGPGHVVTSTELAEQALDMISR